VYACRGLDPRDVTVFRGIPVTTVARTLVELTDVLTVDEITNVIHEAAFRNRFSLTATKQAARRANGRHKLHLLDEAITLHLNGSAGTKSRNEVAFLSMLKFAGITKPLVNTKIHDLEVDFHWPDRKVVIEIDGQGHDRPRTKREDKATDAALKLAGWQVMRVPEEDLERRPEHAIQRVREVIGCASP
jgi:very-short-patch-repair endonuclease